MKRIEMYQLPNGKVPFEEWLNRYPKRTRWKILEYVKRVSEGGGKRNVKSVGDNIFEIKIDYGPGIRVYFGELEKIIILLLLGGDKSSQKRDISRAKKYWRSKDV